MMHVPSSTALCTSTSILGRRRLVEFVLGCTRRHDRDESKIVAFHIKIIIYRTDSVGKSSS